MNDNFILRFLHNLSSFDMLILFLFCLIVIISRIPFMSKFLYDWDSVNYALAFENYDILLSQPHPPGYILFVAVGKAFNFIFNDPNVSLIFLSMLFSILTVIFIYFLAKEMFSHKIAIFSVIILIFNPIFWFYGEIAAIYMSEAFFAALIAYSSYQIIKGNEKFIYISAIILGLSGGFRQDLILFMFPLWLFCLYYKKINYKKILKSFSLLMLSILIWYIPTILLAGGYANYNIVTSSQLMASIKVNSIIFGANISNQIRMDSLLFSWSILGIGIIGVLTIILFLIFRHKIIFNLSYFKNKKLTFLILWIIPSFIFYLLILIAKPGYILIYLPSIAIILGYIIFELSSDINKIFKGIEKQHFFIPILIFIILFSSIQFFYSNSDFSYAGIQKEDQKYYNTLKYLDSNINPENSIIFTDDENLFRKLTYFRPNYDIYCYSYLLGTLWHDQLDNSPSTLKTVSINSSTEKIVFILYNNSVFSYIKFKEFNFDFSSNGINFYQCKINQNLSFEFNGITFKTI